MPSTEDEGTLKRNRGALVIAAAVLLLHAVNGAYTTYGYFRDELYYIACSEHIGWGYVDHPPLSIALLWLVRAVAGDSLFVLRFLPGLAHALTVLFTASFAGSFGGGQRARTVAALGIAAAPGITGINGIYSMNAFDILLWSAVFFAVLRLTETDRPYWWLVIGAMLGLGMMNKISMGWLAVGIAAGTALTPLRRWLRTPWPWSAAALALLLFLPYIIWNVQNDWAHLEFARNASSHKYASQNPVTFLLGLLTLWHPLAVPVWTAGAIFLFRSVSAERKVIGYAVATVLVILLANVHSKAEYFNPAAPPLFAAGAVWLERATQKRPRLTGAYAVLLAVTGAALLPLALDIVPAGSLPGYMRTIGAPVPSTEGHRMGALPQHFADRHGWKELAERVAEVYTQLPEEERQHSAVYTQNYGEAAAIDFFGRGRSLPPAMSGHNSNWLWSRERISDSIRVLIAVGGKEDDYRDTFSEVTLAAVHRAPLAMPYEAELPIYICRGPRMPLRSVWPATKHYM